MKLTLNLSCKKRYRNMNFKTILIPSIILVSFMFSKPINRPIKKIDNSNHTSYRNREVQEIVNIDFEGDLSEWTQSTSNGWILTTNSSNSPTHSYNSPDDYNGIHILRSQEIDLPNLSNEEIIQ